MTSFQQRIGYYVVGALVLAALWYVVAYRPGSRKLQAIHEDTIATERKLAEYHKIVNELPSILEADRKLQAERRLLNSSLYAKGDVLALFQQLTQDAAAYDLNLVQISPPISELLELNRQATADNNPLFLNVTVDFEGQYLKFGRFCGNLETKPYFRAVRSCQMRSRPASPTVDLSLSFKALLGTTEGAQS